MKKRLLSLIMAVMMVVVLVVPAAAATTDTTSDGTVTVYVTYGMFTEGGYDTAAKAPKAQEYNSDAAPTSDNINANFYINAYTMSISDIKANYMETRRACMAHLPRSRIISRSRICWMLFWLRSSKMALTLPIPTPCMRAGIPSPSTAILADTSITLLRSTPSTTKQSRRRKTVCCTMCIVVKAGTLPAAPTHPTSRLLKPTAPALLWKTA